MTDLRARLEQTLWEHRITERCDNGIVYCKCAPHHPIQGEWAHTCHQVHVLLSLLGIAIVELPNTPTEISVTPKRYVHFKRYYWLPRRARAIAAALLAAANAAEVSK